MTQFYAQPYDISATGFYFETMEDYGAKYAQCKNDFGGQVEEFEIQFIDGEDIDFELFKALGVSQCNMHHFIEKIEEWEDSEKEALVIAVGEGGYSFDFDTDDTGIADNVDIYYIDSMKELAEQFVEDGLYGEIPQSLQFYIDYEAIARDLAVDYTETRVAGVNIIYRLD